MMQNPVKPSGSELDLSKATEVEERLATAVEMMREQAQQLRDKQLRGSMTATLAATGLKAACVIWQNLEDAHSTRAVLQVRS